MGIELWIERRIESLRRSVSLRGLAWRPGSTCAVALFVAMAAGGGASSRVASVAPGAFLTSGTAPSWPESRAGQLSKGWVEAFDAGEPAMRKFLAEYMAAARLAKKGVDERLVTYRMLREKLGTLTLAAVVEERPDALDVALADSSGTEHEFTFELEALEPRKLSTIIGKLVESHSMFPH